MNKRAKLLAALLALAAAGSAAFLLLAPGGADAHTAQITQDGAVIAQIDLSQVEQGWSFAVEGEGGSNTVQVEPGRIRVSGADCPDQVCVARGWLSSGTAPIVCLPHKLMIEIVGGGDGLDAAAG